MPADGEVAEGRSYVDESMVTGESRPISKSPGQSVIGGTVNNSNVLIMKVLSPCVMYTVHSLLSGE